MLQFKRNPYCHKTLNGSAVPSGGRKAIALQIGTGFP